MKPLAAGAPARPGVTAGRHFLRNRPRVSGFELLP